jgi:hypothetical protein
MLSQTLLHLQMRVFNRDAVANKPIKFIVILRHPDLRQTAGEERMLLQLADEVEHNDWIHQ